MVVSAAGFSRLSRAFSNSPGTKARFVLLILWFIVFQQQGGAITILQLSHNVLPISQPHLTDTPPPHTHVLAYGDVASKQLIVSHLADMEQHDHSF